VPDPFVVTHRAPADLVDELDDLDKVRDMYCGE
jgi:hypothetical protein